MVSRSCRMMGLAMVLLIAAITKAADPPVAALPVVRAPAADLDKTYRLDFKLEAPEVSQAYVVVTSQSTFKLHYGARKDGNEYAVDLEGTLAVCDGGNRVRVCFTTTIERSDQAGDGFDLSSSGSAIVALGKPKTVATYGEYELKLTATADEEKPHDEKPQDSPK